MAVLFVSHSSKDDAATTALEAWLVANGFTDTFIDHHSIAGGDAWGEALQAAAGTARSMLHLKPQCLWISPRVPRASTPTASGAVAGDEFPRAVPTGNI